MRWRLQPGYHGVRKEAERDVRAGDLSREGRSTARSCLAPSFWAARPLAQHWRNAAAGDPGFSPEPFELDRSILWRQIGRTSEQRREPRIRRGSLLCCVCCLLRGGRLEATGGFEPPVGVLQTPALPLGDVAGQSNGAGDGI